jgi:arylsulfatase A-like enzyme
MKNRYTFVILTLLAACAAFGATDKPNIIYILCDDLGYGDVQCLNPERGKIKTPHMDRLAAEGMTFTDAHTSSSVCTPSRYGILTGRYNWRTELQDGVLWGYSEPLIDADRLTVAGFLKTQGYSTACFGKWHLGMLMPTTDGTLPVGRKPKQINIVWDGVIEDNPIARGFDTYYGISASLDMAPYIWIENDHFVGALDNNNADKPAPGFSKEQVLPTIGKKTIEYIQQQDGKEPFFIYVPLNAPHTPIVPTQEWKGKSGLGNYGDFVMQTDHVIGEIMSAVDASKFADNTIVIVTADNGCSKAVGGKKGLAVLENQGHYPSAQFRGSKADIWDGGHRVPFLVRWPDGIKAGTTCDQTICLTDLMATCADLAGATLPGTAGEDSVSFAPALKGEPIVSTRNGIIHHSIDGYFAYRQGKWKLCLAKGSGGWTAPNEVAAGKSGAPEAQLYDMEVDPGETTNLYQSQPEVAKRLLKLLEEDVERGRSTKGAAAENDVKTIKLWKNNK